MKFRERILDKDIKFRVFFKNHSSNETGWLTDRQISNSIRMSLLGQTPYCHYMQYSDFDDKNRNKIYEGDIVKFPEDEWQFNLIRLVVCYDGAFQLLNDTENASPCQYSLLSECEPHKLEIVGNIYDTPSLLSHFEGVYKWE